MARWVFRAGLGPRHTVLITHTLSTRRQGTTCRADELVSSKRPSDVGRSWENDNRTRSTHSTLGSTAHRPSRNTTGDRRELNPRLVTVHPHVSALVRQRIRAAVARSDFELRPRTTRGKSPYASEPHTSNTPPTDRRGPPHSRPRESRSPNTSSAAPPPAGSGAFGSFVTDRLSNSVRSSFPFPGHQMQIAPPGGLRAGGAIDSLPRDKRNA